MDNNRSITTRAEFLELTEKIYNGCEGCTEKESTDLIRKFIQISGYPEASDLIFYPEDDAQNSPELIVSIIEEYRRNNGLPLFE